MAEAPYRLVYGWEKRLRRPCRPADPGDADLGDLLRSMGRIMRRERGVGLAAPQAGDDRRVVLVRHPDDPPSHVRVLLNPEIVATSEEVSPFLEGCLSFPGVYRTVLRPSWVRVRYTDPDGSAGELEDDGLLARIVQHEIDHLDGVLLLDHLSSWERFRVRLRMLFWRLGMR